MTRLAFIVLAAALLSGSAGLAQEFVANDMRVERPWARATPPGAAAAGGYMVIENRGAQPDRLVRITSPLAASVTLHETAMRDGIMTMRPLDDGLEIAAHMSVALQPGGYHLMFMHPTRDFAVGERVPALLEFERAGEIAIELTVEPIGAAAPTPTGSDVNEHAHGAGGM